MRFPTMWYVRPAKPKISLRIRAVWSEPLLVAWVFYDCLATDWTSFGVSKLQKRLHRLVWVYTCQNATLLEITCHGSLMKGKHTFDFRISLSSLSLSVTESLCCKTIWKKNNGAWWVIFYAFDVVCWHFSKLTFSKNSFRNTTRVSNSLDLDQDQNYAFDVVYWHFSKLIFSKNSFRNTTRVSNGLDPDQERQNVGPDLGPNCLYRLSAEDGSRR